MPAASTPTSAPVRERILVATLEVIAAEGLDAVRHRRVADLAGVSLGSTTYHFASREELIEEAFAHYLDEATQVLEGLAPPTAGVARPVEALVAYLDGLLDREFRTPGFVQAEYELILYAARNPALAERLAAWEGAQAAQLEAFLRSTGAARPKESSQAIVALIRGLELERLIHPERRAHRASRIRPLLAACYPEPT
jgi:DNA-binding transcriptional regulator YbjK